MTVRWKPLFFAPQTTKSSNFVTYYPHFPVEELCRTGKHHVNGNGPCDCDPDEEGPGGRWSCEKCGRPTKGVSPILDEPKPHEGRRDICDTCWVETEFSLGIAEGGLIDMQVRPKSDREE